MPPVSDSHHDVHGALIVDPQQTFWHARPTPIVTLRAELTPACADRKKSGSLCAWEFKCPGCVPGAYRNTDTVSFVAVCSSLECVNGPTTMSPSCIDNRPQSAAGLGTPHKRICPCLPMHAPPKRWISLFWFRCAYSYCFDALPFCPLYTAKADLYLASK